MCKWAINLVRILLITAVVGINPALAAKQEPLLPLLATDIPAVCGCAFTRYPTKGEGVLLHWASEGQKQGVVRTEGTRHVLNMRQEKRIPERSGAVQPNDRLIVFVANGDWQIQVLGTAVAGKCGASAKQTCTARYQGRLLVQQDGGARNEIPMEGLCGCPKP